MGCDINAPAAQATFEQARAEDLEFDSLHPCDLTQEDQVRALMQRAAERFGGIDMLVNAGGPAASPGILSRRPGLWRRGPG